ncbi:MAG: hypothetical protein WCL10_13535 [Novosphingobium sp.]
MNFLHPGCLFNRHSPVRMLSPPRYLLMSRSVKISQCRLCGKVIFRYSGVKVQRWQAVKRGHSLTTDIKQVDPQWKFVTDPMSSTKKLRQTRIERTMLDPDELRTRVASMLTKLGSPMSSSD